MKHTPVYLVGGDEFSAETAPADRRVLSAAGGSRVAVVPTAAANQRPELAAENGVRHFSRLGSDARAVMIVDEADADDPDLCALLNTSDLIYLTGGDPAHLVSVFEGSAAVKALREAAASGTIIGGSSAGAMALGPVMAHSRPEPQSALGFVDAVTIPHAESIREERLEEMAGKIGALHPLAAIPSRSSCLVAGGKLESLGPDRMSVYLRGRWRTIEPGAEISLSS